MISASWRRAFGRVRKPKRISMTVMAVIQTDAEGCASSQLTTGFSGSLRIRAEMTFVSRTIILRNPLVGSRSVAARDRSEEHTSELQSHLNLVCRLLLEKKKRNRNNMGQCYDHTRHHEA